MIEATQKKLREAQFFLGKLYEEDRKPVRKEPEAFSFYQSALLSAGRSVTFALQVEAKAQYDAWFPQWLASLPEEDQQLLGYLKDQRNLELHNTGSEVEMALEFKPISAVPMTEAQRAHVAYGIQVFSIFGTPEPQVGIPRYSFSTASSNQDNQADVVEMCRRYVCLLDQLVRAFIAAHS
jgi:hypothetical protein